MEFKGWGEGKAKSKIESSESKVSNVKAKLALNNQRGAHQPSLSHKTTIQALTTPHILERPLRQQLHHPALFHLPAPLPKIPLRLKRPMQAPHNPIRQSLHIHSYLPIHVPAPTWEVRPLGDKALDGGFTHVPDKVDGGLQREVVLRHYDADHVVRVVFGLFDVEREDVLG